MTDAERIKELERQLLEAQLGEARAHVDTIDAVIMANQLQRPILMRRAEELAAKVKEISNG